MLEEWETTFRKLVLAAPDAESADLIDLYQDVLVDRILPAKGNDPTWASRVHSAMLEAGLTDVDTTITSQSWPGGTAGALLIAANIGQLREEFLEAGMTAEQLDEVCRLVTDPRIVLRGHFTYSTIGPAGRRMSTARGPRCDPAPLDGARPKPVRRVAPGRRRSPRRPAAAEPAHRHRAVVAGRRSCSTSGPSSCRRRRTS